jgi:hypothetical protein
MSIKLISLMNLPPFQTKGKSYDIEDDDDIMSFIGDNNIRYLIFENDITFVTIEKWRENQIDNIL